MSKPNIIYVFADQFRFQSCGYAGDKLAHTPNIDQLAEESTDLYNAISGHPVCSAYRASLFTGKYTTSTGMVINEIRMNPNHRCLAHVLTDNGYKTAYKIQEPVPSGKMGMNGEPCVTRDILMLFIM